MKQIAGSSSTVLFVILAVAVVGCTREAAIADAKIADAKAPATRADLSRPAARTLVVPTGTSLVAVLRTPLSTDVNSTGDAFARQSSVQYRRWKNRRSGRSRGSTECYDVQASGRIKGRARMTLVFYKSLIPREKRTRSRPFREGQAASETATTC
jgi:hypothetical protein